MKDSLIKRNIKCMTYISLKNLTGLFVIIVIMAVSTVSGDKIDDILESIPDIIIFIGIYMPATIPISIVTGYLPIILSMGSGRRDYVMGKHMVTGMITVLSACIVITSCAVTTGCRFEKCMFILSGLILSTAIGNLLGNIIIRYGTVGYLIYIFTLGVNIGIVAVLCARSTTVHDIMRNAVFSLVALSVAILVYIISVIFELKVVNKYEIR